MVMMSILSKISTAVTTLCSSSPLSFLCA